MCVRVRRRCPQGVGNEIDDCLSQWTRINTYVFNDDRSSNDNRKRTLCSTRSTTDRSIDGSKAACMHLQDAPNKSWRGCSPSPRCVLRNPSTKNHVDRSQMPPKENFQSFCLRKSNGAAYQKNDWNIHFHVRII